MTTAAVDICNNALSRLGVPLIATLGVDGTPQDNFFALPSANPRYVDIWKEVMRAHPWNALRARTQLQYTTMGLTLSSLAVGTGITATAGSAFFNSRDVGGYLIEQGSGATGISQITAYTNPTVVTITTTTAWSTLTPAANAWMLRPPGVDFSYCYLLPSDWLAVRSLDSNTEPWQVEAGRLLTTYASAILLYTRYESSPDLWDQLLQEAIVGKSAMESAWPLTKDAKLVEMMGSFYASKIKEAQGTNKSERQPGGPAGVRISKTTLLDVR